MRTKLSELGICEPCGNYEITKPGSNKECYEQPCAARNKLDTDGSCTPCADAEITDPANKKACIPKTCNKALREKVTSVGGCEVC